MKATLKILICTVCFVLSFFSSYAQELMKGKITVVDESEEISNVIVQNINTQQLFITDANGKFEIKAKLDDLIEFRKIGYKTIRVRIKYKQLAPFYHIQLPINNTELEEVVINGLSRNFKLDSIKNAEIYKNELNFYKLEGLGQVEHATDYLSKKNRQIWRFQKNYAIWQADKFVDFMFSDDLIKKLTNMRNTDSLMTYRRIYRPEYQALRSWTDYEFGMYIKETVADFRRQKSIQIESSTD